jgi:hypothetical protein
MQPPKAVNERDDIFVQETPTGGRINRSFSQAVMSIIVTGLVRFTGTSIVSKHPAEVTISPVTQDDFLLDEDGGYALLEDGEQIELEDNT